MSLPGKLNVLGFLLLTGAVVLFAMERLVLGYVMDMAGFLTFVVALVVWAHPHEGGES